MILSRPALRKPAPAPQEALSAFNARAEAKGWQFTCLPAHSFEKPELEAAAARWYEKAGTRAMPRREDLTARVLKPWLTNISLIEYTAAGHYRVRLHGSALARYAGDVTGKLLEEVVAAERLAGYAAVYDLVRTTRMPLRVLSRYQAPELAYLTGESFVAPLSHGDGGILILSITYPKPREDLVGIAHHSSFG